MNEPFDPYYTWLGIPPHEQPANFYRLLGIQLFEPNQKVIDNAADRQMMLLRSFQNGPNSEESQRLLNEVSAARGWLLDPQKKAGYDHQLGQLIASRAAVFQAPLPPPLPLAPSIATTVAPPAPRPAPVAQSPTAPTGPSSSRPYRPSSRPVQRDEGISLRHIVQIVVGGVAGLGIAVLLLNYFVGTDMLGWSARSRKQAEVTETPPVSSQSPIPSRRSEPTQQIAPRPDTEAGSPSKKTNRLPDEPTPIVAKTTPDKSSKGKKRSSKSMFGPPKVSPDDEIAMQNSPPLTPKSIPPKGNTQKNRGDEIDEALETAKENKRLQSEPRKQI
jgi:hypothetical protein